ncbi:MAG: FAD binding domain-containing protein [Thaumarchaeota archaeon]|nr:FAD binding domain-containing protein [Nitrososphaerota archaeon]
MPETSVVLPVFKPQRYVRAKTPEEVLSIMQTYREKARIVGGNTFLNELAKRGLLSDVEVLLDIEPLELHHLKDEGNRVVIGASTKIEDLAHSPSVKNNAALTALAEAAQNVHPVQIRNLATVGGCISTGVPFLDVPVALLALNAEVRVVAKSGEKSMPIDRYLDMSLTDYMADKFVKELVVTLPRGSYSSCFRKFGLTGFDYALVNVAARTSLDINGICGDASIAVGGKGVELSRMKEAEAVLTGKPLNENTIGAASQKASDTAKVEDDIPLRGSAEYKKHIVKVMVNRALAETATQLGVKNIGHD